MNSRTIDWVICALTVWAMVWVASPSIEHFSNLFTFTSKPQAINCNSGFNVSGKMISKVKIGDGILEWRSGDAWKTRRMLEGETCWYSVQYK